VVIETMSLFRRRSASTPSDPPGGPSAEDQLCAGCGLPLDRGLQVRDIDSNGGLADYHQACAPSLAQRIDAGRLNRIVR
jgi:hypothetical protein